MDAEQDRARRFIALPFARIPGYEVTIHFRRRSGIKDQGAVNSEVVRERPKGSL